jgi:hypothetical protein
VVKSEIELVLPFMTLVKIPNDLLLRTSVIECKTFFIFGISWGIAPEWKK